MEREPYWDYMGRRLREEWNKETWSMDDMYKKEVSEMQSSIHVLQKRIKTISEQSVISVDTETTSINPIEADLVGLSFSYAPNKACYIPVKSKSKEILSKEKVLTGIRSREEEKQADQKNN